MIYKETIKKHEIIKNNQNAKYFVLRRLIFELDKTIKEKQKEEIGRLKSVYERREINDAYNKEKYRKYKRIKIPFNQKRLET